MTKRNEQYWKNRAAQRMWEYMQSAEETADEAAKFYQKAAAYLNQEIDGIFEKYMTKHNLSEREAYDLLNQMTNRASIQELLQKLQNGAKDTEKEQIIQKLEAPAYRARIERLEQIQSQLDQIMRNVYQQELALSTSHYAALAEEAYYKSIFDIQQRSGYGFSFAKVDQKMIDRLLKSKWSGKNYSTRIWNNTGALAQTLKEELLVSLVTGRTERETAAIIMQKFAQGSSQARRLIRTESSYITGQMDLQSYNECGIEKYVYLATLDLRTCQEDCAPLDGKIFPVKDAKPGVNMPPMHPWCRCTTISYFSDEILRSLRRRARDPVTGKTYTVPGDMTYQQWYQKYVAENPEAKQKEKEIKNRFADRKQYDQYKEVLGSNMPKSFAKFQKMKYNEPEKWEELKALKLYLESNPGNSSRDYYVQTALKEAGIKGIAKVYPVKLDVSGYSYDSEHINAERAHMVSRGEAERFIAESDLSLTRWNGRFVNYYSKDGATYVDVENKNIRTAFTKKEFDENTLKIREVIEKYAGKNSHMSDTKKAD